MTLATNLYPTWMLSAFTLALEAKSYGLISLSIFARAMAE